MLIAGAHSDVEEERFSEDELAAEERSSKWYTGYTASTSGCPCWFDIQANDTRCACCQNGGIQCGYPKQDRCWHANKWGGVQRISRGCSGPTTNSIFLCFPILLKIMICLNEFLTEGQINDLLLRNADDICLFYCSQQLSYLGVSLMKGFLS